MAKVSSSAMWSATGMANVQASAIPAYLKDKGLYDGSAFINDPDACSIYQEAPFQNTNLCSQGLLFLDFAKALCRAEMVNAGIAVGAYSVNKTLLNGSITTALRWHPHRLHLPAIRFASATIIRQGISVPLSVWVPLM